MTMVYSKLKLNKTSSIFACESVFLAGRLFNRPINFLQKHTSELCSSYFIQ